MDHSQILQCFVLGIPEDLCCGPKNFLPLPHIIPEFHLQIPLELQGLKQEFDLMSWNKRQWQDHSAPYQMCIDLSQRTLWQAHIFSFSLLHTEFRELEP
nr:hypothetical protein Iba_chr07cCG10470 [Ipomoea batatas]